MQNDKAKFKNDFKQRLYRFVLQLVVFVDRLPKGLVGEVVARQLLRSGTSIPANYIEAKSASSKRDFVNFFTHSLKSANETAVWLSLLRDSNKGGKKEVQWFLGELSEITKILAASILTLKGKR